MQVTLSEDAKRRTIFKACVDAKDKLLPTGIVEWLNDYECLIKLYSQLNILKTVGHFHKKQVSTPSNIEIHCVRVKIYCTEFSDLNWGEVRVKSLNLDFDCLAEEVAHSLEQYTPVFLIINNASKIEDKQNPSKR